LTETSEEAVFVGIVEDIAVLARKLAEQEPFKSASGPEAVLALATHLDGMVATARTGQQPVVRVAVGSRRNTKDSHTSCGLPPVPPPPHDART
jgi:hypothetical protein